MQQRRRVSEGRKVGEVAQVTGLTVRTLHYYEEIGLLDAPSRSAGGHRLYAPADLERLYRICLLRQLGLPLADIAKALDQPDWRLRAAMSRHLEVVQERLQATERLRRRLLGLLGSLGSADGPPTDDLFDLLQEMTMLETTVQRRISYLVYADIESAHQYLVRVFGLGPGQLTRDDDGRVVHAELQAGDGVVWLHPESPDFALVSPRSAGAATAGTAVIVDDVDEHHRRAVEQGAVVEYGPTDQPYGYREYSARDLEGGLWSFMKPLA